MKRWNEEIGKFVDGSFVTHGELTHILIEDTCKCCELLQGYEFDDYKTLDECLEIAKKKLGYDGYGIILVIDESYLDGFIYRYGNYPDDKYRDKWQIVGIMEGFA